MGHELTHEQERIITVDSMDPTSNSLLSEVERFLCVTMQYLKYGSRFSTNRTLTLYLSKKESIDDSFKAFSCLHFDVIIYSLLLYSGRHC